MIADVIVETKTRGDSETFSYLVPDNIMKDISVGSIVEVPFGSRTLLGVVNSTERGSGSDKSFKIKNIKSINPLFSLPKSYIKISKWISSHYFASLGESTALFLPPKIKRPRDRKDTSDKIPALPVIDSEAQTRGAGRQDTNIKLKKLNSEQTIIFESLKKDLISPNPTSPRLRGVPKPALIHGVTGSGKTEIYIKLAKEAIKNKKQVVVLVPEIMLTPQTIQKFREVFPDQICLMHSKLNMSEKYHCYNDFYSGNKSIVIGPRSALLVPSPNIGLIIVDEEQEESYKQEQNPRYNAIDLAEKIAQSQNALLVLGTATPRIETYFKAKEGIYNLYKLENRYNKLLLPPAEIINLKDEIKKDNHYVISEKLQKELQLILKNKKQALLFLNRRGSSTFVSCRECGFVVNCPKCEIPLIHHNLRAGFDMRCHHCDYRSKSPTKCPKCESIKIKFFGAGVEKVEAQLQTIFPKARIRRVDSDTIRSKKDYDNLYNDVRKKKVDFVLGTQMLAKGHDFPEIDLVGIISADTGLHMPHFRASERTFRILTQVSGRSGRTHNVGKTIIQTYWPNSRAIIAAQKHDFELFYNEEIKHRKESNYPPFSNIVRIVSEDRDIKIAKSNIMKLSKELEENDFDFIGPGLAFFQRIRDKWRYHIIVKLPATSYQLQSSSKMSSNNSKQRTKLYDIYTNHKNLTWNVDAYDLL